MFSRFIATCGFFDYCQPQELQAEYPIHWLPSIRANALKEHIAKHGVQNGGMAMDAYLEAIHAEAQSRD